MKHISLDKAELIAIFLETFLYGIFFTLFWITLWVLLKKGTETSRNRSLIALLVFMLILITAHITIDFIRIVEAFIVHIDPASGGPTGYYAQLSHPLHVSKNVLHTVLNLTGDLVMAWRCYIINRRSYLVVVVPVVLIVSSTFCGFAACWSISRASIGSTMFVSPTKMWMSPFFILTLSTNAYCTAFIVYRIFASIPSVGSVHKGSRGLMAVLMAVVESGGLYASALLALLATYLLNSNGQIVASDVISPLIGVVFTLIIIQIDAYASAVPDNTTAVTESWRNLQQQTRASRSHSLRPFDITVTTHRAIYFDQNQSRPSSVSKGTKQLGDQTTSIPPGENDCAFAL